MLEGSTRLAFLITFDKSKMKQLLDQYLSKYSEPAIMRLGKLRVQTSRSKGGTVVCVECDQHGERGVFLRWVHTGLPDDVVNSSKSAIDEATFSPDVLSKHYTSANEEWETFMQVASLFVSVIGTSDLL